MQFEKLEPVRLPRGPELIDLLDLEDSTSLDDVMNLALNGPLQEFIARPRKGIRSEMVALGYDLIASRDPGQAQLRSFCAPVSQALELLHAGSLVVDDIEDGSSHRRGQRSLHELHGIPLALNAGNWLYFWPLKRIDDLDVPAELRSKLSRECHETLLRAHYGQAIDVGTPITSIDRKRIPEVSMAALQLKTGALMALALKLGAILAGANSDDLRAADRFGHRFGVTLQMFDDLGNVSSEKPGAKRFEDFKNARPGFLWCVAALELNDPDFDRLVSLSEQLPASESDLSAHLEMTKLLELAQARADHHMQRSLDLLQETLNPDLSLLTRLNRIQQELRCAYV